MNFTLCICKEDAKLVRKTGTIMESLFDLTAKISFDENTFANMRKTAIELLHNTEKGQYTQAIVLSTAAGNEYSAVINNALSEEKTDETDLLEKLKEVEDTNIRYVLCIWQDNSIDIPSFAFRNMLYTLNSKNSDSLLFVMTDNGVSVMKLSASMK